jgi:hypothetical protein
VQLPSKYTRGLTFQNFLLGYDPRERILSRHRSRQLIAQRAGRAVVVNPTDDQLLQPAQHIQGAAPDARAGGRGGRGAGADHESNRPPPPTLPRHHPPRSGVVGCGGDRGGGGGGGSHSAGAESEAEKGPSAPSTSSTYVGQATVDMSEPFACGSFKARIPKSTVTELRTVEYCGVTVGGTGLRVLTVVF